MKPPPLSGPALRAVVAAAESSVTGDLVLAIMRQDSGIAALLGEPLDADDNLPLDERPLVTPRREQP